MTKTASKTKEKTGTIDEIVNPRASTIGGEIVPTVSIVIFIINSIYNKHYIS